MITMDMRRIICAKELQARADDAMMVVREALTPKLHDQSRIDEISRLFSEYIRENAGKFTEKKRALLFVMVYLYCPAVLLGESMPRGFRDRLKDLLGVGSPSAVSNYTTDLLFFYNHYKDFRKVVEDAYAYIMARMS